MRYPLTVRTSSTAPRTSTPTASASSTSPTSPRPSLGELTYRRMGELAAAQAAKLDQLGVPDRRPGGVRVAELGPPADLVLRRQRVRAGARADQLPALAGRDPLHRRALRRRRRLRRPGRRRRSSTRSDVPHKFVLGEDDDLYLPDTEPRPWAEPDEDATATINYTSGTTARPKGVQLTHRNNWLNATVFGLHTTISDRDVYLHTLPMFHANGWGMPFAHDRRRRAARRAAQGRRHRDPAPRRAARRHRRCAPRRRSSRPRSTARRPGTARSPAATASASSPPARRRPPAPSSGCIDELGWEFIQIYGLTETSPLLTINRSRAEWDDLSTHERAKQPRPRRRAGPRRAGHRSTPTARC